MSNSYWITLTSDMVTKGLNKSELTIIKAGMHIDELDDMIADLIVEIRMIIASGGRSKLSGESSLIPHALKSAAVAILRYRLLTLYPNQVSDARTKEYETALRTLESVRSGQLIVADPAGDESPPTSPKPHFSGREQRWGHRRKKGIM